MKSNTQVSNLRLDGTKDPSVAVPHSSALPFLYLRSRLASPVSEVDRMVKYCKVPVCEKGSLTEGWDGRPPSPQTSNEDN